MSPRDAACTRDGLGAARARIIPYCRFTKMQTTSMHLRSYQVAKFVPTRAVRGLNRFRLVIYGRQRTSLPSPVTLHHYPHRLTSGIAHTLSNESPADLHSHRSL